MELMAPAGNLKSFFAALYSNADSIYLGLKKFNARIPADNFTPYLLKKAVEYAHSKNIKVYLTLNIDIKENELYDILEILEFLVSIKIDAVIIRDPALILIINKFYKDKLKIHLSTQTAITNSYAMSFAEQIGATRVVLARELELNEIKACCEASAVECEIFIEGSLCFSVSGRCLASSWVGGRSGNRGLCTAPCRVLWENNGQKDNFFSMKDLSLLIHLDEIKKIGVKALKIEGRLKNPYWIKEVVSIYKKLLNGEIEIQDAKNLYEKLKKYSAREIQNGHLFNHSNLTGKNQQWDNYQKMEEFKLSEEPFTTKKEIIFDSTDDKIYITITINEIKKTIELKYDKKQKKAKPQKLEEFLEEIPKRVGENIKIELKKEIFLTSSTIKKIIDTTVYEIRNIISQLDKMNKPNLEALNFIKTEASKKNRAKRLGEKPDKIIINLDQINIIENLKKFPIKEIVIYLNNINLFEKIYTIEKKENIIISLPAIAYESEIKTIQQITKKLLEKGFYSFEANSFCGIEVLKKLDCNRTLGPDMGILNHIAADFFYSNNINSVYASVESDISSLKALSSFVNGKIEMVVFGKIKLFTSRVESNSFKEGEIFTDSYNTSLVCHKENSVNIFVTEDDFSLINDKLKEQNIYFDSLTADLRYYKNPDKVLNNIFTDRFDWANSKNFNISRKLQ